MFKRILLFVLTNILVIATITIVLQILGIGNYLTERGIDYGALLAFCLVWGMVGAFISLGLSRIMAKWSMRVRVIDPRNPGEYRDLVAMVQAMSQKAGLPALPEIGVYESADINAFATGPSKRRSLVAVSTGLLQRMDRDQVEGVIAHEVAHIANGDMVTMTLIQGVINAFVMFFARVAAYAVTAAMRRGDSEQGGGHMLQFMLVMVFQIVFGLLGSIVVAWFSRLREFRADRGGALYAGKAKMIAALQGLQRVYGRPVPEEEEHASLNTLKISGRKPGGLVALLSTHPPLEMRIARLQER
jgi:heat shock protein HtpX